MKRSTQTAIRVEDFTEHKDVKACLNELKQKFNTNNPLIVSDVLDRDGHQYVNLVQKGGGVLGVALVGYTYILEQMGIRFIRLAGTSAGAINTALMAVIGAEEKTLPAGETQLYGNKKIAKSEKILEVICNLNFFDLVDGHPVARLLIKNFITNKDFTTKLNKWITGVIFTLIGLVALDFILLGLQHLYPVVSFFTKLFFILTGFFILLLSILSLYTSYLVKRLKDSGFGINPGDFFYDWIKTQLKNNHVKTVSDLEKVASTPVPDLYLRTPNDVGLDRLEGDVTFITSEIVSENKIEFPKMWNLFRINKDDLQPAGFIRASMAIPIFFESYFINDIPCADPGIQKNWQDIFGETDPPSTARFVDGGILSNFPISLFYNPEVEKPRLPSLGIDLDDEKSPKELTAAKAKQYTNHAAIHKEKDDKHAEHWSFVAYLYRIFNTVRFYYDKDFLIKNRFFRNGIGVVPLKGFNWLNFFLSSKDKERMFVLGAQAATRFLLDFNWDDYKNKRIKMQRELIESQLSNPVAHTV